MQTESAHRRKTLELKWDPSRDEKIRCRISRPSLVSTVFSRFARSVVNCRKKSLQRQSSKTSEEFDESQRELLVSEKSLQERFVSPRFGDDTGWWMWCRVVMNGRRQVDFTAPDVPRTDVVLLAICTLLASASTDLIRGGSNCSMTTPYPLLCCAEGWVFCALAKKRQLSTSSFGQKPHWKHWRQFSNDSSL